MLKSNLWKLSLCKKRFSPFCLLSYMLFERLRWLNLNNVGKYTFLKKKHKDSYYLYDSILRYLNALWFRVISGFIFQIRSPWINHITFTNHFHDIILVHKQAWILFYFISFFDRWMMKQWQSNIFLSVIHLPWK